MSKLITVCLLLALVTRISAAPKPFSCISFQENDEDDYVDFSMNDTSEFEDVQHSDRHLRTCMIDYTFCFALWRQTSNGTVIEKQGCWKDRTERNATCYQSECTSSAPTFRNNSLYYCCCSGNACNERVAIVEPTPLQLSKEILPEASNLSSDTTQHTTSWITILIYVMLLAFCIISIIIALAYLRNIKEKPTPEEAPLAPTGPGYSSNLRNVDNINLICMLGSGKYGTVMKGLLHDKEVAVKIFPEAHRQYYINERNIYSLPMMDSPALLQYFGYDERHTIDGQIEYQLVLSLAPLGCLHDWLIANSMDFQTFCGMVKSITRGVSHLHTEIIRGEELKPCVAHRDLNSRNVLIKADKSCCIADFGFALKVFGAKYEYKGEVAMAETKSINEVGTLRYMAPELLEGAVNLRDCETSLKQMDVYALGLVLWEVATRCADFYALGQNTPPYKAPYEAEVGSHPTFDQMQTLVVRHKARPLFPAGWGGGTAAKLVRDTCEDCWDHDAEARLTSLCAEERMQEVAGLCPKLQPHAPTASPLLNTNNLVGENSEETQRNVINDEINHTETTSMLNPPPNQQILPRIPSVGNDVNNFNNSSTSHTEKNHFMYTQQPLQPYQGRNPCLERNLAPVVSRPQQIFVEKSKKHSFQTGDENSFSCLEDDVSVEELISNSRAPKFCTLPQDMTNMGQGFPKQQNTDKKLRGWHSIRAVIQKKLFRKEQSSDMFRQLNYGDEKSNLVDNRFAAVVNGLDKTPQVKQATVSFIDDRQTPKGVAVAKTTTLDSYYPHHKRPNNLDLSPIGAMGGAQFISECNKSNLIHTIAEEDNGNPSLRPILQSLETRTSTPAHIVPRSLSTSLIKNQSNNNITTTELNLVAPECSVSGVVHSRPMGERQFKRQRSLEVFKEVFSGRGSTDRLRDPSQRVKTPGDVPPSVRKIRASKTLSLYDDRMMDSSTLNIL